MNLRRTVFFFLLSLHFPFYHIILSPSMMWKVPDNLKELAVCSAVYGMLGQIYTTEKALKEFEKKVKQLITRHQDVQGQFLQCIRTFSELSNANSFELDKIRADLVLATRENQYVDNGEKVKNWNISTEYRTALKQNIIDKCDDIEEEVLDCLWLIQKTIHEFNISKGVYKSIFTSIITSWAGMGGLVATRGFFHTRGLFAFGGAFMGTCAIRFICYCTSHEEDATMALLRKMKIEMELLLGELQKFVLLSSSTFTSIKSYEAMALDIYLSFNLSTDRQEVARQTLRMLMMTNILQLQLQNAEMQGGQIIRRVGIIKPLARIYVYYT